MKCAIFCLVLLGCVLSVSAWGSSSSSGSFEDSGSSEERHNHHHHRGKNHGRHRDRVVGQRRRQKQINNKKWQKIVECCRNATMPGRLPDVILVDDRAIDQLATLLRGLPVETRDKILQKANVKQSTPPPVPGK